jgi:RNA polymerase sigma-70 factor (ECF subfamily)
VPGGIAGGKSLRTDTTGDTQVGDYIIRTAVSDAGNGAANFSPPDVYYSQNADDVALIKKCLAGDTAAFEPLVQRYQRILFNVALRMLGDYAAADDATQNAFVRAYRKLDGFDPNRRFFSWIYRILVNECLNDRRDRRLFEPLAPEAAAVGSPADELEAAERRRIVQTAILALPPDYREVVVLRHFAGLAYDEIADAVGVPVKTVKSRLHTARERLSASLKGWEHRK